MRPTFFLATAIVACSGCGGSSPGASLDRNAARTTVEIAEIEVEGAYRVTVPPDVFGTVLPIEGRFRFAARNDEGRISGGFVVEEFIDGTTTHYRGVVTCVGIYDFDGLSRNRAKVGGRIERSDDPAAPAGTFIWWQAIDERERKPDQTTLAGFGDGAANQAFCDSPRPPRFGPFAVRGHISVE